ncbi:Oligopeptide ABC transporter, permease protein OppB [[Mycoplasma] cavipharyngis]|uniref:ABC transporter permease n=1 Tax=[Mycoplasma] cavipharyngis TaxID=92757 RepID=UPI0037044289
MVNYLFKRIVLLFFTLFFSMMIVYLVQSNFGPNPFTQEGAVNPERGTNINDLIRQLIEENGFNKPAIVQFFNYLKGLIFEGNLGKVYVSNLQLPNSLFEPLQWTLLVTFPTFILSVVIGVILGTVSAYYAGRTLDRIITSITTFLSSIPSIVIAPLALLLFYRSFGLPLSFILPRPDAGIGIDATLLSLITPIFVLTITSLSGYILVTRNQMLNVLTSNYVLIAKTKGLSAKTIFFKYVLRNASLPLSSIILSSFIGLLSGTIILERFFGIPGSADPALDAALKGEINIIMFNVLFFGGLSLGISILIDVLFTILDPRIKIATKGKWYQRFIIVVNSLKRNNFCLIKIMKKSYGAINHWIHHKSKQWSKNRLE